jgi:hypothetical protein
MGELEDVTLLVIVSMIDSIHDLIGPATAQNLRQIGKILGKSSASLEELQGKSYMLEEGLFLQPKCPFADAIAAYLRCNGSLPPSISKIAETSNRASGEAWVSAFCAIHQALRAEKLPGVRQVGCKSASGEIILAKDAPMSDAQAYEILEEAACVYVTGDFKDSSEEKAS